MNNSESKPPVITSESINKMLEQGLKDVQDGVFFLLSDPNVRAQMEQNPDLVESAQKYEAARQALVTAAQGCKDNPTDNMARATYHHACADIMFIGGSLLDKVNAASIQPTKH
jgi:hypothetical protein